MHITLTEEQSKRKHIAIKVRNVTESKMWSVKYWSTQRDKRLRRGIAGESAWSAQLVSTSLWQLHPKTLSDTWEDNTSAESLHLATGFLIPTPTAN